MGLLHFVWVAERLDPALDPCKSVVVAGGRRCHSPGSASVAGARRQVVYAFWSRGHPVVRAFRRFPYTAQRGLGRFPYTTSRERTRPSGAWDGFRTRLDTSGRAGGRTLHASRRRPCTNPCWDWPSIAQSPCRRFRAPRAAGSRLAGCSPTQSAEEPRLCCISNTIQLLRRSWPHELRCLFLAL